MSVHIPGVNICDKKFQLTFQLEHIQFYTYHIAEKFSKVKLSCFSQFDPIRKGLFAKSLQGKISKHKRKISIRK